MTQTGNFVTLSFYRLAIQEFRVVCKRIARPVLTGLQTGFQSTTISIGIGLQTGFQSTTISIGELDSKPLFKKTGVAPVLELIYLSGIPGLNVGCDPLSAPGAAC